MGRCGVNSPRALFILLGCLMVAILVYAITIDGLPFHNKDLLTLKMAATLVDLYVIVFPLACWVCYKESNWFSAVLWIILLVCFGSITTCVYIVLQLFKLSSQEILEDPIYYVLRRNRSKDDGVNQRKKISLVVIARILFIVLGVLVLGTVVYSILTASSSFRKDFWTRWMAVLIVDVYINNVALSVWFAYKAPSCENAFLWIFLLVFFGSITTCVYIVRQLFQLSSHDPVHLILFRNNSENSQVLTPI